MGRIVAQVIGAVASIVLAVWFLQRTSSEPSPTQPPKTAVDTRPASRRPDGRITLAVKSVGPAAGVDPLFDNLRADPRFVALFGSGRS